MPITIKELISSDSMSGVIEKINFNFDQLILAGGGPPGIQGLQGIDGPIGPQGFRGDHWFAGPSAYGQTADHDGLSELRVQDHFIDSTGEVYQYFSISGSTGWTASGINLRGPEGPQGAAGGSLEWKIYLAATAGNAIDGSAYSPTNVPATGPDPLWADFLIPNMTYKNSIFIGDGDWAFYNLKNFGTNPFGSLDTSTVPKFTVIQNNINQFGQNGVSFGGPLFEDPALGSIYSPYGNSGVTGGGKTYSAYNFVNAAFATEEIGSAYITKFKVHSYRSNIKIQAGGIEGTGAPAYRSAMLEMVADNIKIQDYFQVKNINIVKDYYSSIYGNDNPDINREILLNAISDTNTVPGVTTEANIANIYGYIGLQNAQGGGSGIDSEGFAEHHYGNVIIGPTYNKNTSVPLATNSFQGLAIVRKITKFDGADAAIRFFQPDSQLIGWTNNKLNLAGSITPVRTFDEPIEVPTIYGSTAVLDSLMITAGVYNIDNNTQNQDDVYGFNGGRLGLSNNAITINKPQFPLHVSIIPDATTRFASWDGDILSGSPYNKNTKYWFAGFDTRDYNATFNPGIGFGMTEWRDDLYVYSSSGVFGKGTGTWKSVPRAYINPVIRTYNRGDVGTDFSYGPAYGPDGEDGGGIDDYGYGQINGKYNAHIYLQPGSELNTGNVGIGFVPGTTGYVGSKGISIRNISFARSKMSINGSITVGPTYGGYHSFFARPPIYGALVGGLIAQGDIINQGLGTLKWKSDTGSWKTGEPYPANSRNFSSNLDDYNYKLQVGFASEKIVMAKRFLSKGHSSPMYPDFILPDAKTGMGRFPGEQGTGALFADRSLFTGATTVSDTVSPIIAAKWSGTGDGMYKNAKTGVAGFSVTDAFALSPIYLNINTLPTYAVNVIPTRGGMTLSGGQPHQIVYYQIPAKNSTVFLDLSYAKTNYTYFKPIAGAPEAIQTSTNTYLDGYTTSGIQRPLRPNSQQFTVENGYYEGQILRIMVLDVHSRNCSVLVPNAIPPTPVGDSLWSTDAVLVKDNLALAAEKYSGATSSVFNTPTGGWPLVVNGTYGTPGSGDYRPWPLPLNNNYPSGINPGSTAGVMTAGFVDAAILRAFNQLQYSEDLQWTTGSYGNYDPSSLTFNGGHGAVMDTVSNYATNVGELAGIGAFRITPWRSLTLQWKYDGDGTYGQGCWYEIARENLVPRKLRAYSGSGDIEDPDYVDTLDLWNVMKSDDNLPPYKNPTNWVSYSFYNPGGESKMEIYAGSTLVRTIQYTESGYIPYSSSMKVIIRTPLPIAYGDGLYGPATVETRCKISSINVADKFQTTILKDIVKGNSTGTAVVLDTNLDSVPTGLVNLAGGYTYAIEGSAIIKRNS